MKKRTLALLLSAALCVGMLAGCGGGTTPATDSPAANTESQAPESESPAAEQITGTVNTNGSTSMESVMGYLMEGFAEVQPGVTINYTGSGSGAGVTGAQDGTCDIGLASRALKDEEKAGGLTETIVALDGIAVIVNAENSVTDLSLDEIAAIYTGEVTDWSAHGSEAGAIAVIGRESGSGTRDGFESITGTEDTCVLAQELNSTGAVIEAVRTTPGAIGYASLSAVEGQEGITVLTVDGVAPSEATVLDGTYQIQRPFVFATRTDEALSEAAQAFFDWATSEEANSLIEGAGAVPVAGTEAAA